MATEKKHNHQKKKKKSKAVFVIAILEILLIAMLFGGYRFFIYLQDRAEEQQEAVDADENKDGTQSLTKEQQEAKQEQERLRKEEGDRQALITKADQLAVGYDYDGAIELLMGYQGAEGGYQVYTSLTNAIARLEEERDSLSLYGGVYNSVYEISHLYFSPLIADTARAFDGDSNSTEYNKYNVTISEFEKILQSLYEQNYVLVNMSDIATLETQSDGSTRYVANKFYLQEGKKPIIISEDDVNYYDYMQDDGFAARIILDDEGSPTCEMLLSDGSTTTGAFDIVPIVDAFVKEHPDFSYRGAKGLLTLTGYEGILGYRTNDTESATYAEDVEAAKAVVEALKAEGWEFGCHSYSHKNMQTAELGTLKNDTDRWLKEVGSLVGETDIYVFPFGNDIEAGAGIYSGAKYQFLKENGFNIFLGVYKEPWLHIKNEYVRMTRRPIDGQVFMTYPDRLSDLFSVEDIVYPSRPSIN